MARIIDETNTFDAEARAKRYLSNYVQTIRRAIAEWSAERNEKW